MLRVTLEMIPGGDEKLKSTLGIVEFDGVTESYSAPTRRMDWNARIAPETDDCFGYCVVSDWPRGEFRDWDLLIALLLASMRHSYRERFYAALRERGLIA